MEKSSLHELVPLIQKSKRQCNSARLNMPETVYECLHSLVPYKYYCKCNIIFMIMIIPFVMNPTFV